MTSLFYFISLAVGGLLALKGLWQLLWYFCRFRLCTAQVTGLLLDSAERKSLLAWPNMYQYYPIFEYHPGTGESQILASSHSVAVRSQIPVNKSFTVRYDPRCPSRFFVPDWDRAEIPTGLAKLGLGLLILAFSWFSAR